VYTSPKELFKPKSSCNWFYFTQKIKQLSSEKKSNLILTKKTKTKLFQCFILQSVELQQLPKYKNNNQIPQQMKEKSF